ncbi:prephenate dehydratase [Candidatus Nitrosotenuis uzonensis]|uniref:prephenate dehydratase n=1 Tax=Candidatus Nitrosotenuis uzonensis TaxID=1407055 RepID=V6AR27_9ARCH|nr:prephenate dehydratase [Candidatus Nitrosotenuis uzonensis]CDI05092.1 putative Prephenate dehydratase [Candidatus Nitrosotenuis uzonensis]
MDKVSFQGERGAYSEDAAITFFGTDIETIPCATFAEVVAHTENNKTKYSVLPVENSLEGSVGESYDLLLSTNLTIVGEIYYRVRHCLIGFGKLGDIDTVYSHPQALGQCRNFIQKHQLKTVPAYDTAGSVKIIKEIGKKNISCIASKRASEIYGVAVIAEGIEDNANNYTRFLVLSKSEVGGDKDKTSIIFSIKHESGALYNILKEFNDYKISLTKIESRPNKSTPWEYNFYVDFDGRYDDPKIMDLLEKITRKTVFLKILGSYKRAKLS